MISGSLIAMWILFGILALLPTVYVLTRGGKK
jgi:hypothetical protein